MALGPAAHCHAKTTQTMDTVGMALWLAVLSGQEGHNLTIQSVRVALAVARAFQQQIGGLGSRLHGTAQLDATVRALQFAQTIRSLHS